MEYQKLTVLTILITSLLGAVVGTQPVYAQAVTVAIEPNEVRDVASFHVDLVAGNVPADIAGTGFGLFGFQALVTFDPAVLTVPAGGATFAAEWQAQIAAGCAFGSATIAPTGDAVNAFITLFNIPGVCPAGFPTGFSGTVGLVGINFNVDANNVETVINIDEAGTILSDVAGTAVAYTSDDGFFSNRVVVNNPPVLTVPGPQMLNEGTTASFMVTADDTTDSVSDTVTITASGVPSFASCPTASGTNSATMTCTLNPGELDDGVYTISFSASDAVNPPATGSVQVTVSEVPTAPTVNAGADVTINEGQTLTRPVTATDLDFVGGSPQTLSFSLSGSCTTQGATINMNTGTVSWVTDEMDDGVWTCTVTISDGALTGSDSFQVTVNEVNSAPSLTVPLDFSTRADQPMTPFAVSASETDVVNGANQEVTLSATDIPAGMTCTPTLPQTASSVSTQCGWTPASDQAGPHTITWTANDGAGAPNSEVTDQLTITVVTEPPPTLSVPADFSVNEGTTITPFTVAASDSNAAQTVTLSAIGIPPGMACSPPLPAAGNPVSTTCDWTPSELQDGQHTITFTATDGAGLTDSETISITVNETNEAPVLDPIGNRVVEVQTLLQFTTTASDPDVPANILTFLLDAGSPEGASITTDGAFSWTPTEAQSPGVYSITVRVTDNGSPALSDFETIQVEVREPNRSPDIAPIDNKSADEETGLSFPVQASDPDGDPLTFSVTGAPGASISGTGLFSWTPTEAQGPGTYQVTVTVSDGSLEDSQTFTVEVFEVNKRPVLSPVGDKSVEKGNALTFTVTATDGDLPANTLTFSLGPNPPSGASITPQGSFTWTPSEGQAIGEVEVIIRVSDGTSTDEETISITASEPQRAPPVSQPFWVEFWWAILLAAVIIVGAVALVIRGQSRKPVSV